MKEYSNKKNPKPNHYTIFFLTNGLPTDFVCRSLLTFYMETSSWVSFLLVMKASSTVVLNSRRTYVELNTPSLRRNTTNLIFPWHLIALTSIMAIISTLTAHATWKELIYLLFCGLITGKRNTNDKTVFKRS